MFDFDDPWWLGAVILVVVLWVMGAVIPVRMVAPTVGTAQHFVDMDDSPEAVYHHPATPFVATFMGYQNLFDWHDGALCAGDARVPLAVQRPARHLAWRPEHVAVGAPGSGTLDGRVLARSYLGERIEFLVHTALGPVKGCADLSAGWREGADVGVRLDPAQAALI